MNVLFEILPETLKAPFSRLPHERVYELRLRCGKPAVVTMAGRSFYLSQGGLTNNAHEAITPSRTELETIIHKACNYSVYAANEQIIQGFITIRGGVRIGICGEVVTERGTISTIKNISSLNIRVPHEIRGCSYKILPYVFEDWRPLKTLIISPPGAGKTTLLRDLAVQICEKYTHLNVLILDERGEIAANYLGENQLDVGTSSDILSGCTKSFGFENGIRSMRPDVIICDEIATPADAEMLKTAAASGVIVIASVHAGSPDEIRAKPHFRDIIENHTFDRYIVLTTRDTAGIIAGIYDRHLKLLSC